MKVAPAFLTEAVTVRTFAGETGRGPRFLDPIERRVAVKYRRRNVPQGDGEDVLSEATLTASPDDRDVFKIGSEIELPDGRESKVLEVREPRFAGKAVMLEVLCR